MKIFLVFLRRENLFAGSGHGVRQDKNDPVPRPTGGDVQPPGRKEKRL